MSQITAENIQVEFPIYDSRARSLRHRLVIDHLLKRSKKEGRELSIGGHISQNNSGKVIITALDDLSFSIKDGDRLGLLGHNGAGKSTLLKVMAKIYEPTSGSINVNGRISPMFNLSDGMDQESTGLENIWLRGRVLGISKDEINSSIDSIASFTDLGEYLHMPIRTYSSGMLVRLSFAIATAVQPDILIMDEMIGAGDATFTKQANERLQGFVEKAGLMVVATHSLDIVRNWCNVAMVLHHGKLMLMDSVENSIKEYKRLIGQ